MLASEYVQKLRVLIDEYGDLECIDSMEDPIGDPEEIEGAFVLADKA